MDKLNLKHLANKVGIKGKDKKKSHPTEDTYQNKFEDQPIKQENQQEQQNRNLNQQVSEDPHQEQNQPQNQKDLPTNFKRQSQDPQGSPQQATAQTAPPLQDQPSQENEFATTQKNLDCVQLKSVQEEHELEANKDKAQKEEEQKRRTEEDEELFKFSAKEPRGRSIKIQNSSMEKKEATRYDFHGSTLVAITFAAIYIITVLICLLIFKMNALSALTYTLLSFSVGGGSSYFYYLRKNLKKENTQKLNLELGKRALTRYLIHPPTWIRLSDQEKCEWMNDLLEQVWPYYDKAVCDYITESLGPKLTDYAFPPVKKLTIEKLRFGDSPIRFESVKYIGEEEDALVLEMEVRWKGDSKIILGMEAIGFGDINPSLTNITFSGCLRIYLKPLVPVIPGFGAVLATFRRPPIIKYQLNFGKLGGSAIANQVKPVIDNVIREQLANLVVFPNRYITPILGEDVTGNLNYLKPHTKGILKVHLIRGIDIKKMDITGTADGYIEMYTQQENTTKTKTVRNSLDPVWDEIHFHLIQEPTYQFLKLNVFDIDLVNLSQVAKHGVNVFKGVAESLNAKNLIGRSCVDVLDVCKSPGVPYEHYYPVGPNDFSNPDGVGFGKGQLQLNMTFQRIQDNDPFKSTKGALLLHLKKGKIQKQIDENMGEKDVMQPYVKMELHDQKFKSFKVQGSEPVWDQKYTWFKVESKDQLKIQVFDETGIIDKDIASYKLDIKNIIESTGQDEEGVTQKGYMEKEQDIGGVVLDMALKFIAYY